MSRSCSLASLTPWRRVGVLAVALAASGLLGPFAAMAQFGGSQSQSGRLASGQSIKLKSPASLQVFQRDGNGRATIPIALDDAVKDVTVVDAVVLNGGMGGTAFTNVERADRARFV